MLRIWRVTAFRGHEAVLFQCVCTCVVSVYVVVWFQCTWWCGFSVRGGVVSVYVVVWFQCNVVVWFQCMWWCGFGVCGGVVSVYVAVWFQCM